MSGWALAFYELFEVFLISKDLKFNFGYNALEHSTRVALKKKLHES